MEHLSVAIADDNQRILDMLDDIIQTDKELDLVGKAKNGEEMCQIIKDRQPDVVLLDLIGGFKEKSRLARLDHSEIVVAVTGSDRIITDGL